LAAERARALFLSPECPYPLTGGGQLRSASLLHALARTYAVDVVAFREPGAADPASLVPPNLAREVMVLELAANRRSLAAKAMRNAGRLLRRAPPLVDRFSGFHEELRRRIQGRRYRVALIEHFWCAPYADVLKDCSERVLLDLHNIESVLHARCAVADPPLTGAAHRLFARASYRLERAWLPRFDGLLVTSAADAERARAIAPDADVRVYPNAIPWTPRPQREDSEVVAFSGNLEYHPNLSAVRFFREDIWPALRERWPALRWRLVGRNPHAVARYTAGDPRIETTGPIEDAIAELARVRVAVAPLLAGSGTRFKILEAWAAGTPVVSTAVGAEGLPARDGENILLADNASEFAGGVSRLLESAALRNRLADAGRALFERDFTWEAAWKTLSL
jgi:glycosyltransferase involved in cell wall biosynthesis